MLRYTVTVSLPDEPTAERFVGWLRDGHIEQVMAGGALDAEISRVDDKSITYDITYRFPSRQAFSTYERDHAPRLRAEGLQLFPPANGIAYQRRVSEILTTFPESP